MAKEIKKLISSQKETIIEVAKLFEGDKDKIIERWNFLCAKNFSDMPKEILSVIEKTNSDLVNSFMSNLKNGNFDGYFEFNEYSGKKFAEIGVSYNDLIIFSPNVLTKEQLNFFEREIEIVEV